MFKAALLLCLFGLAFAGLDFHIELSADTYASGDELIVHWELNSDDVMGHSFLRWGTPLEMEWNSNMFSVLDENNRPAAYQGRVMKRAPPTLDQFEFITRNSPKQGSLVLSNGYAFYSKGTYSVTLNVVVSLLTGEQIHITSNTVEFTVTRPNHRDFFDGFVHGSRAINFTGCSVSQTSVVNTAIPAATTASLGASAYMNQSSVGTPACTSTYQKWFGSYTSTRWNKIQEDFANIHSRFGSRKFNIDCTCKQPGTYAFVYPSDPTHTIHLCPVFWDASSNPYAYNSQPGTLTHEMSHFNDVAGTNDYQYGVTGCLQLAEDSPSIAVSNADSHEYFQESQPVC